MLVLVFLGILFNHRRRKSFSLVDFSFMVITVPLILVSISRSSIFSHLPINLRLHSCNVASFSFGSAIRLSSSIFGIDERGYSPFVWSVLSMQRTYAPNHAPTTRPRNFRGEIGNCGASSSSFSPSTPKSNPHHEQLARRLWSSLLRSGSSN